MSACEILQKERGKRPEEKEAHVLYRELFSLPRHWVTLSRWGSSRSTKSDHRISTLRRIDEVEEKKRADLLRSHQSSAITD
jgi:hypothetical protein